MLNDINFWTNLSVLISGMTDLILFIIAIRAFFLTYISKKIELLSFGFSFNSWKSDGVCATIKNRTLRAVAITEIHAIINNKYKLLVCKFDTPLILEPLKSVNVQMDPFTRMQEISLSGLGRVYKTAYLELMTDDSKKVIACYRKQKIKHKNKDELTTIHIFKYKVGDFVLRDDYAYMIHYKTIGNNEIHTAFINKHGMIGTDVFGFNAIPKQFLKDTETIEQLLAKPCKDLQIKISIQDIRDMV